MTVLFFNILSCCHAKWAVTQSSEDLFPFWEGWMSLYKDLVMADESLNVTMQHTATFSCSFGVLAGVTCQPKPSRNFK